MIPVSSSQASIGFTQTHQHHSGSATTSKSDRLGQKAIKNSLMTNTTTDPKILFTLLNETVLTHRPYYHGSEKERLNADFLKHSLDNAKHLDPESYSMLQAIARNSSSLPPSQRIPVFKRILLPYQKNFFSHALSTAKQISKLLIEGQNRIKEMDEEASKFFKREFNAEIHDTIFLPQIILEYSCKDFLLTPKINAEIRDNGSLRLYVENVLLHRAPGDWKKRETKLSQLEKMGFLTMDNLGIEIESITDKTSMLILEELNA